MLLFVHMHKCAGTTVRKSAAQSGLYLPEPNRNGNLCERDGKIILFTNLDEEQTRLLIRTQINDAVGFMAVEHSFPRLEWLPLKKLRIFTVLRDPFERAVSNYRYAKLKEGAPAEASFRQVMGGEVGNLENTIFQTTNFFVRFLNRLPPSADVTVEHLAEAKMTLKKFEKVFVLGTSNLEKELPSFGITHYKYANSYEDNASTASVPAELLRVTQDDKEWFKASNKLDIRLVRAARRWITERP